MNQSHNLASDNIPESPLSTYRVVIGLEVHAQILSKAKLFSSASAQINPVPNSHVSYVDAAFPGMLPVLNDFCVTQAIKTSLALNGTIHTESYFERKNYFYPDLPQGYQITQFSRPLMTQGYLEIQGHDGALRSIGIHQLHLEQDAGKSLHDMHPDFSFIDLNRSGVGLMEIVSEPHMHHPIEAIRYVKKLRAILKRLGTCDTNMDEGSLRIDANISLHKKNEPLGERVELKNMNSLRFLRQALEYEMQRQQTLLEQGEKVRRQTRLFDTEKGITISMRDKEVSEDYCYFPDPDLLPLVIQPSRIQSLKDQMPELPDAQVKRFQETWGLSSYDAELLVEQEDVAAFFESTMALLEIQTRNPLVAKIVANWMNVEIAGRLNRWRLAFSQCPLKPLHIADLAFLMQQGTISSKIVKEILDELWQHPHLSAQEIISHKGWQQVDSQAVIQEIIDEVLEQHADSVQRYHQGKDRLFEFFVGQTMGKMKGKGNPDVIRKLLLIALKSGS